jgi:aspartyl-tRNA synthetase
MPRTLVRDLRGHLGQTVTLRGWVNALRLQRVIQFVIVRDFSGLAQLTHKLGGEGDHIEQVIESLSEETAVTITGRVVENPVVNLGGLEIIPERIEVLGRAETPLPIDEHSGPEHRLDWRFLDVRKRPAARCIFQIQTGPT